MPSRDPITIFNERVKLGANTLNAMCLGLLAVALIRPIVEPALPVSFAWGSVGLALHLVAHYVLGRLKQGA